MGFCAELMRAAAPLWEAEKRHPFVQGLGRGDLDAARFRFYLEQDYLFLIAYAKVFSAAVIKAPNLEQMAYFAQLCADTLNNEMALHRAYCREFGILPQALEQVEMAAVTSGYSGHLQHAAFGGELGDLIAAVLPCQWGYNTIARHLQAQGRPADARYQKWIETYASAEFEAYGSWLRAAMESCAAQASQASKARWVRLFQASSRWELLFWEMAWQMERWRIADLPPTGSS